MNLYEILVPTAIKGKNIRVAHHKLWDTKVRDIAGGLSIFPPIKGHWISSNDTPFVESMIPVRIMCTQEQIEKIADLTLSFYNQEAVMYYKISDEVTIKWPRTNKI